MLFLSRGDAASARRSIDRALARRPSHVPSLLIAGRAASAVGDHAASLDFFTRASALAPEALEPALLMSQALAAVDRPKALTILRGLVDRHPGCVEAWRDLGTLSSQEARHAEAVVAFERAAAIDPKAAFLQRAIGRARQALKQPAEAAAAFQRAIALDDADVESWFGLGLARQDSGDQAGAAAAFDAVLARRPDAAEAAVNLGVARQQAGDLDSAITAYRQAYAMRPDTFGPIAQALAEASTGQLWLDLAALKQFLAAR